MKTTTKTLLFCTLLALLYITSFQVLGTAATWLIDQNSPLQLLISEICGVLISCVFLYCCKQQRILLEKGSGILWGILIGGFYFVLSLYQLFSFFAFDRPLEEYRSAYEIAAFGFTMLFVGISEEFFFRGVLFNLLENAFGKNTKHGVHLAVFWSGFLFGSIHMTNILSGVSLRGAISQSLNAIGIGWCYGAIYARSRNIWAMVFLHGFQDFTSLLHQGLLKESSSIVETVSQGNSASLILCCGFFLLSGFLLREKKMQYQTAELTPST